MTRIQQDAITGWLSLYLGLPASARFVDNDDGGWSAFLKRDTDEQETEVVCHYPAAQCYEAGGIHVADSDSNTATHYYIEVLPGRAATRQQKNTDEESVEGFLREALEDLGFHGDCLDGDFHFDDIDMDSLDQVELIMAIEEQYRFEIQDDECDRFVSRNLSVAVAAIETKIKERSPTR